MGHSDEGIGEGSRRLGLLSERDENRSLTAPQLDLHIRNHPSISPEQQLVAQLKLAIMLGKLQPGQTLPSVRELAAKIGVGRNVVWRAYSKLARLGAVKMQQRRRTVVATNGDAEGAADLVAVYEELADDLLDRLRGQGINAQSFVRFMDHRVHESGLTHKDVVFVECSKVYARIWSEKISKLWGVAVAGYDIPSVQCMPAEQRLAFKSIITPLDHYGEVQELFQSPSSQVAPLRFSLGDELIRELRTLPDRTMMAMIFGERSYPDPWSRELQALCPNLRIDVISYESREQVERLFASGRYSKIHLSGPVLDNVYEEIRNSPIFVLQPLELDVRSLEQARIRAGVVL